MTRDAFVGWLDRIDDLQARYAAPIRITFDDGNASDISIALPELTKRNLKASFFLCAGRLQRPGYIDRVAVRELLDAGMEIGSHGMHHRDWRALDDEMLTEEIHTARRVLADACGQTIETAAVPFGSFNRHVLKRLRAEGFSCVYTSDRGLANPHAWLKPRNTLGADATPQDLARSLRQSTGPLKIFRNARRLFRRLSGQARYSSGGKPLVS
jgi:peptidoglycan/xylan/chitin deacetylase (PgdA/CDA1 family)